MYPIEWYMKIFKGYTKNHQWPKASIVESYITKEAFEFCSNYFSEAKSKEIPKYRHVERYEDRGTQSLNVISLSWDIFLQAHMHILDNVNEVEPYLSTQKRVIKKNIFEWVTSGCWKSIIIIL